ncbi:hypothetical protein AAMO2058_000767400 [Amorphochlora amoebiformis]
MVFIMQVGFGLVETGSISSINTQSIILKNLLDVSFVNIGWWCIGYSLFSDTGNSFSGDSSKAFSNFEDGWLRGQFNLSFAAAAATILSGAVAGRIKFLPYCIASCTIGTICFPIVAHWAWASNGWLYKSGFIDFAGGGVIHLMGGVAAFVGTVTVGPRSSRFVWDGDDGGVVDHKPRGHSITLVYVGTMLLWVAWFSFNAGSTLGVSNGNWRVAVVAAFNSSIAPAAAIMTILPIQNILEGKMSVSGILNSALAGLVVVTPGCATLEPWGALVCGILGAAVYQGSSYCMVRMLLDDPVDAFSVHGVCGLLGVILAGVLSDEALIDRAYGSGYRCSNRGKQLGIQTLGSLVIILWTVGIIGTIFLIFRQIPGGLRVSKQDELVGTDFAYFSAYAYPDFKEKVREAKEQHLRKVELALRREMKKSKKSSVKSQEKTDSGVYKGSVVNKDQEKAHDPDVHSRGQKSFQDAHSGGQKSFQVEAKYQDVVSKNEIPNFSPSYFTSQNKSLVDKLMESELEQKALREQIDSLQSAVASLMEKQLGLTSTLKSERSTTQESSEKRITVRVHV